jgi:hypothetical protein
MFDLRPEWSDGDWFLEIAARHQTPPLRIRSGMVTAGGADLVYHRSTRSCLLEDEKLSSD